MNDPGFRALPRPINYATPLAPKGGVQAVIVYGKPAWVGQVNLPGSRGFLAAAQNGINYYPIASFEPNSKVQGWEFSSGGVPAVAALMADVNGDGVPVAFLARLDGFVNVLKVADGSPLGLLNAGEPVLGLAMLKGKDGKPALPSAKVRRPPLRRRLQGDRQPQVVRAGSRLRRAWGERQGPCLRG